ncbi:hypothetical protein BKA67DRAFT_558092 [Truncatella angustata]|uniref:Extracellular membrane protein CFEM domain-containing protein n=1 Tax=Truncatella angustata TaxID=152316 RepID=A0A9P8UTY4_9PEZI|nr:uncharacterized protein BKA67DRAFT_558092 [Truncatella angustata]KAH6658452.1 hypothetical protein BKA67DRAFT_558092 [Truncatella angustata]
MMRLCRRIISEELPALYSSPVTRLHHLFSAFSPIVMARLSAVLVLFSMLGANLAAASPVYDQEQQERDATCDNNCFFGSFPGGSCTNDAACMCTQQKYREKYFCCMAEKCAASVMPDSITRQTSECEARNLPFTFDAEAVCGIKLTTSSTSSAPAAVTVTVTSDSPSSTVSTTSSVASAADTTAATSSSSSGLSSSSSQTGTGGSTPSPTANSAPVEKAMLTGIAGLIVGVGTFLL